MLLRSLTRREALSGLALAGLASAAVPLRAVAATADGQSYPMDQLLAPMTLPDVWMGAANAPVTIIEFASMTCTHCAAFHAETWPTLKSKYIDTGKVRFVLREFPLDPLATAGFMLARCAGADKRNAVVDLPLRPSRRTGPSSTSRWKPSPRRLKQAGISQADFETCLKDQKLYDQVNAERDDASKKFGIQRHADLLHQRQEVLRRNVGR